jgi:PAS domain S-box-containing protein
LDDAFRFTYLNQRALDHFGEPRESLLGKALWDVVTAENRTIFQQEYERAVRLQCSVAFEAGSPLSGRWVEVRAYPTAQGLAAYFRDVTDRKGVEEQLQEADRRKSEFLAVLAHELRNPLAALRYGLHIVERGSATEPTSTSTLGMMDRQMTHLGRLVDDLLDLSRITRGKLELRRQKILLAEVLERAVEALRAFIDARRDMS